MLFLHVSTEDFLYICDILMVQFKHKFIVYFILQCSFKNNGVLDGWNYNGWMEIIVGWKEK